MTDSVPSNGKKDYYSRRAAQERQLAQRTADRSARCVHDELASRYAELAGEPAEMPAAMPRAS